MAVNTDLKILLVEDSNFVRRSIRKGLNGLGYQNVTEAEDGNQAIERLEQADQFDVIVSDWVMPNKDGFELLLWVRASEKYKLVPFIMATARGEKKQVAKASEAGATDFITKPFGAKELLALIETIFNKDKKSKKPAESRPRHNAAGKLHLKVAHIQITDHLGLGILKHLIKTEALKPQHFELETVCMSSWNPVQKSLESGEVDAAFILAPIAMDLYSFGAPIKLVLLAHKNGSIFVRKRVEGEGSDLAASFRNKTFYLPHEMSIHHMLSHMFLRGLGLKPGFEGRGNYDVFFEVIPPVQMPEYLAANPTAAGYLVAEPMGTKAIAEGIAELTFLSGELWENHPCCVVAVRDELVQKYPDAVQELTNMLVEAGQFIERKPETSAQIGVPFLDPTGSLGLREAVLRDVLKEDQGIKTGDLFPVIEDLDKIQRYMVQEMGLGTLVNLEEFVDTRFAEIACRNTPPRRSVMHDVSEIVAGLKSHQSGERISKASLNLEGKYLIFNSGSGTYGLDVLGVREIIEMKPITVVPHATDFIKGVINVRGDIVPVVDLRYKLGLGNGDYGKQSRIVVVEVASPRGILPVGIAVNSVSEVVDIQARDIDDAGSIGHGVDAEYILGYYRNNGDIKILLNAKQLFQLS
ncbi:MAG TPA: ABC transporter substrate-binding protein [Anaerolineae bacterium]|nr:ABC transporter substrate-binding protein [Anaerolineae bacterium]